MAATMTDGVLSVKEKWIEELENHFHEKLRSFTSDVKMKMRSVSKEAAIQVFEFAVLFLTQTFPDLGGFESASDVIKDGTMELRNDFDKLERTLSQKLKEAQQSLAEKLEDAQQTLSEKFDAQQSLCEKLENAQRSLSEKTDAQQTFCEKLDYDQRSFFEKLEDAQQNLSEKFSEVQEKASFFQHKVENDLDKLNEANESNTHQILGLRKLQKLLSDKTKISQTTAVKTPSTTKASASAAATPCRTPKSLSQRSTFSARAPDDTKVPNISDTKLLPFGLVVVSDYSNKCVKLYDWQGRHIHTQALDSTPYFMTVMDIGSPASWDLCVTLPFIGKISLLGVTPNGVNIKTSIKTTKEYIAIAAVTTQTLAVGSVSRAGIDLIDLSGRILRQLNSTLYPWSMVTTPDGFLMVTIRTDYSVARINLVDETIVFRRKVEQIENHPIAVASSSDGSLIVSDSDNRTLHVISRDGVWIKKLWTHPGGKDTYDGLLSVSLMEQTCVCCTRRGSVFVMDVSS